MSVPSERDPISAGQMIAAGQATAAPRVSVVMTIYNAAAFLKEAIDSVVNQRFQEWELIAIENGSTDASPTILASYHDSRIKTFSLTENIGRTPALRYGVDSAQGEFIAILDADDLAHPDRLERQVRYLDQNAGLGLVGTWAEEIDSEGELLGTLQPPTDARELLDLLGSSNPFVHSAVMYRSELAKRVGGYPKDISYAQDYSLILGIAQCSEVGMIGSVLCKLRSSAASMTSDPVLRLVRAQEELHLLRQAARTLALSHVAERRNRHRQAVAKLKIGVALIRALHVTEGMRHILSALFTNPRALVDNGFVHRHLGTTR